MKKYGVRQLGVTMAVIHVAGQQFLAILEVIGLTDVK